MKVHDCHKGSNNHYSNLNQLDDHSQSPNEDVAKIESLSGIQKMWTGLW